MIVFDEVTKRYGSRRRPGPDALTAVSFRVERGSALAVVGPNGAGKTTLFGLLLGFLRPTGGAITVAGVAPRDYVRRNGVAYLPERFSPPPQWRVRDALRALARLDRAPPARVDAVIEEWGLTEHAADELGELSHGLLQRVGLAQALLAPRELVVLDEPAEGLDPLWRVRLREVLLELRAAGRTILVASHDLAEVERVAGQALLLDDGRVRDVLATAAPDTPSAYLVRLAAPSAAFAPAFPEAVADDPLAWRIVVRDADELSARLAAAIAGGVRIVAVEPQRAPLEERVRRALGETDA